MSSRLSKLAAASTAAVAALGVTAAIAKAPPTITSLTAKQTGKKVVVTVRTRNFTIDAKDVGKKPIAGKGHFHFSMDRGKFDHPKYSGANGKLARKLGTEGKYSPSVTNSVTYTGLPKGKHTAEVYLAQNNHAPYKNKGAEKSVTFTVK